MATRDRFYERTEEEVRLDKLQEQAPLVVGQVYEVEHNEGIVNCFIQTNDAEQKLAAFGEALLAKDEPLYTKLFSEVFQPFKTGMKVQYLGLSDKHYDNRLNLLFHNQENGKKFLLENCISANQMQYSLGFGYYKRFIPIF